MNADDAGVLEAARAIRFYLTDLVGPAAADELDRQITDLLNGPFDRPEIVTRLRTLLEEQEVTGWFLTEVLADAPQYRPPYQQPGHWRQRGGIPSPGGDPAPISAPRYACPQCGNSVWYRPDVGTPIPNCQSCHVLLTAT